MVEDRQSPITVEPQANGSVVEPPADETPVLDANTAENSDQAIHTTGEAETQAPIIPPEREEVVGLLSQIYSNGKDTDQDLENWKKDQNITQEKLEEWLLLQLQIVQTDENPNVQLLIKSAEKGINNYFTGRIKGKLRAFDEPADGVVGEDLAAKRERFSERFGKMSTQQLYDLNETLGDPDRVEIMDSAFDKLDNAKGSAAAKLKEATEARTTQADGQSGNEGGEQTAPEMTKEEYDQLVKEVDPDHELLNKLSKAGIDALVKMAEINKDNDFGTFLDLWFKFSDYYSSGTIGSGFENEGAGEGFIGSKDFLETLGGESDNSKKQEFAKHLKTALEKNSGELAGLLNFGEADKRLWTEAAEGKADKLKMLLEKLIDTNHLLKPGDEDVVKRWKMLSEVFGKELTGGAKKLGRDVFIMLVDTQKKKDDKLWKAFSATTPASTQPDNDSKSKILPGISPGSSSGTVAQAA